MRYLGIALGVAVALGYCAAFGTLIPPIVSGEIAQIAASTSGRVILLGVGVCLLGIALSGLAGRSKERELSSEQKAATIREFDFGKGMLVATFCGVMSSCFAYGLAAGKPLADLTRARLLEHGRADLWQNLPVLIVVLLGGFTTNVVWCVILNARNRSAGEYLAVPGAPRPADPQLRTLGGRRRRVVPAVLLLQHGANAYGFLRVLELDDAHGQHHHLQHLVGRRAARVEGHEPEDAPADRLGPGRADRVDDAGGIRELPQERACSGAGRVGGRGPRRRRLGQGHSRVQHDANSPGGRQPAASPRLADPRPGISIAARAWLRLRALCPVAAVSRGLPSPSSSRHRAERRPGTSRSSIR